MAARQFAAFQYGRSTPRRARPVGSSERAFERGCLTAGFRPAMGGGLAGLVTMGPGGNTP